MRVLFTSTGNPEGGAGDLESRHGGEGVGEIRPSKHGEANQVSHGSVCYMTDCGYYSADGHRRNFEPDERLVVLC